MGRGGARPAAATVCWCSQQGAGEHGQPKHAKAPGRSKEAIPVLNLAEEGVEVGRRWSGRPRAPPVRGGTGSEQFRQRRAGCWTRSGQGASRGGEEAVGSWNLGGVERSR
jgi:hypothetical protein